MSRSNKTLRIELLDMEKPDAAQREKYEKEVQAMFEEKLNWFWRVGFGILSVAGLLTFILFAKLAFSTHTQAELGPLVQIIALSGAGLTLVWMMLTGWIAVRGKLNLRTQPARMAAIGITLGFLLTAYFMFTFVLPIAIDYPTDYRSICGTQLALMGFFLVITIGLCLILIVLYRTESRTREKLLEIELRLVELNEKTENRRSE